MLSRFLAGCFGAAPIAIVGGTYVDFWDAKGRGAATAGFAGATFLGPIAGPIVGAYITHSHLGWRWTGWITMIFSAFIGIIGLFTVPETFAPVLLQRRARKLKHMTKNWAVHSALDESPVHFQALMEKYFSKPFVMLFQEPIVSSSIPSQFTNTNNTASRLDDLLFPRLLNPLPHLLRIPLLIRSCPRLGCNDGIPDISFHRSRYLPLLYIHCCRHPHSIQPSP